MRSVLAYTSARILMFGCAVILLYLAGARGILLLGLGLVISALASYILLNKQRAALADKLNGRLSKAGSKAGSKVRSKAAELHERLEEGTRAEDEAGGEAGGEAGTRAEDEAGAAEDEAGAAEEQEETVR